MIYTRRTLVTLGVAMPLALVLSALLGWPTLADSPSAATEIVLTLEEHENSEGEEIVLASARLTDTAGQPLADRPLDFFLTVDFFGQLPVSLGTAVTNAIGEAALEYQPHQAGAHDFTVQFHGDEHYLASEAARTIDISEAGSAYHPEHIGLQAIGGWTLRGIGLAVLGLWMLMGLVVIRILWGIPNASSSGPR